MQCVGETEFVSVDATGTRNLWHFMRIASLNAAWKPFLSHTRESTQDFIQAEYCVELFLKDIGDCAEFHAFMHLLSAAKINRQS